MIIYLASPYSHESPAIQELRFELVCRTASLLMRKGLHIYSPIAHSHPISKFGLPGGWEFWEEYDRKILAVCGKMLVLALDGWDKSTGVMAEIHIASELSLPVNLIDQGGTTIRKLN